MSRIGRAPISVPKGVQVTLQDNFISVKGPNGTLQRRLHPDMAVAQDDGVITVTRPTDNKNHRALHGLTRALINNMVKGVTVGFRKELEINGVGFRAEIKSKGVLLNVGYTHGVFIVTPPGVKIEVPKPTSIVVSGADAELVGHVAAEIRDVRKPEPYKGKGIRYIDEQVKRKAGKTAKK
ncbi:50S ribosomal protein L6 [candidate division KSB1 bacterium]|nr:50S ribosomal protein L6 [candidate division KSB1 bacterium]